MALRGLRFQRRIKVLPGLRLNVSKSGVRFSIGGRGAHVRISGRGQRYMSLGLPGTGLSYRAYASRPPRPPCPMCAPGHAHVSAVPAIALFVGIGVAFLMLLFRQRGCATAHFLGTIET